LKSQTRRRIRGTLLASAVALTVWANYAAAVPVPFKNCGASTDIISISKMDASIWPPQGTPAPLQVTAIYDAGGKVDRLQVTIIYGVSWVFLTQGGLGITPVGGFVPLPASMSLTLVSPALPIPAGPTNTSQTFQPASPGANPITITSAANIKQAITSVNAVLTLTYNGTSGFPQANDPLGAYEAKLAVTEDSGQGIFCFDLISPGTSFVAATATPVPDLSFKTQALLIAALLASGLYALRLRNI
jgi:hypothetical protein